MYNRTLEIDLPQGLSAFLWGPRKTGKSTLLQQQFPDSARFDLLDTDLMVELTKAPWAIVERIHALDPSVSKKPIIIDEVQKVPHLLDEVHRLIESEKRSFILCSSSARKLRRGRANMLGGRALSFSLQPLTWSEIPDFNLMRALNRGLVPQHYESPQHLDILKSYANDYLKEEVFDEGLTRNIATFSRFFDTLSYCHGEILNFSRIARDCGADSKTVREYFQILEDTFAGVFVEPYRVRHSRAVITRAPKFYLFDVGVAGRIIGRQLLEYSGPEFGRAFEHFILMELLSCRTYQGQEFPIRYWRTKSGLECDFVLGRKGEVVVEVKGGRRVQNSDLRAIRAYREECKPRHSIVVSNQTFPRRTSDGILILPWEDFLERLWNGKFFE